MKIILIKLKEKQELTDQENEYLIYYLQETMNSRELRRDEYSNSTRESMRLGTGSCPACGK